MITRRKSIIIMILSAVAVLLCAALFSVSFAKWERGDGVSSVQTNSGVGQYYVEYPYSGELSPGKYYLQLPQDDELAKYYFMTRQSGNNEEYSLTVALEKGQTAKIFNGTTQQQITNKDGITCLTYNNDTITATQSGVYTMYYMVTDYNNSYNNTKLYATYRPLSDIVTPNVTIKFADGDVQMRVNVDDSRLPANDWGDEYLLRPFYMYIFAGEELLSDTWPGTPVKSGIMDGVEVTASEHIVIDASAYYSTDNTVQFIFGHNNDSAKTLDLPLYTTFLTQGSGLYDVTFTFDNYTYKVSGADTFAVSDDYVEPSYMMSSLTGDSAYDDTMVVRRVSGTMKYDEANDEYTYHNYVCVSRKNADGDEDNSICFVEFQIEGENLDAVPVKRLTITRAQTMDGGKPTTDFITPAPRLYNYDSTATTYLSELGHSGFAGDIDPDLHMIQHYVDGMYCILFFADGENQYFALDIEIVTSAPASFTLTATASNINHWQRFEQGYGQTWGIYMGGLVNNVWLWDPRRTTQMSGTVLTADDVQAYDNIYEGATKLASAWYPIDEIDMTLTVNLTEGSLIKPYMLDDTGYRMQDNPKEPDAVTSYLLPKEIIAPEGLYKDENGNDIPVYNTDPTVDSLGNINLRIPKAGDYTFRLVGKVSPKQENGQSYYINLKTGESRLASTSPGSDWYVLQNYNFMVDKLYISTVDTSVEYTVTFDAGDGQWADGTTEQTKQVKFGAKVVAPDPAPTNGDQVFLGWYTDGGELFDFETGITGTLLLHAMYRTPAEIYTITFDANGGTLIGDAAMDTDFDGKLSALPTATHDIYTFVGWFTAASGGTMITADTVFAASMTVYAQWERGADNYYIVIGGVEHALGTMTDNVLETDIDIPSGSTLELFNGSTAIAPTYSVKPSGAYSYDETTTVFSKTDGTYQPDNDTFTIVVEKIGTAYAATIRHSEWFVVSGTEATPAIGDYYVVGNFTGDRPVAEYKLENVHISAYRYNKTAFGLNKYDEYKVRYYTSATEYIESTATELAQATTGLQVYAQEYGNMLLDVKTEEPAKSARTFYLIGSFNGWVASDADYRLTDSPDGTQYQVAVYLEAGATIKLYCYGYGDAYQANFQNYSSIGTKDSDGNLKVTTSGTYAFYYKEGEIPAGSGNYNPIYVTKISSSDLT